MLAVKNWKVEGYSIEDFQLKLGQKAILEMPGPIDWGIHNKFCEFLVGKQRSSSIQLEGQLMFMPLEYRKWSLFNRSVKSYLSKLSISETDISRILRDYGIQEKIGFNNLGYSERCLLGIEVAICKKQSLLYSSAGLDVNGLHRVREKASDILKHGIVIEINYPNNKEERLDEHFLGAKVVSVIHHH